MAVYDPADQAKRRRRARIAQQDIADRLKVAVGPVSEYEHGKKPLPWNLTGEDYELALAQAIVAKRELVG